MADFIDIRIDQQTWDIAKFKLQGIPNGMNRAMTRSLNAIARKNRTRAVDETYADIRVDKPYIRKRIWGPNERNSNKATFTKQRAKVTAERRGLRLSKFMNEKRTLVQEVGGQYDPIIEVKVKRKGRFKRINDQSAFLFPLRRGTETGSTLGIFVLDGLKLKHLHGPSVSQVFDQEREEIAPDANRALGDEFNRQVKGVLATL